MEIELNRDFKDLLRLFSLKSVRYLLIGGYAVILHGHPRFTNDLDLVIANDSENIDRCVDALRSFGFTGDSVSARLFALPRSLVRLGVAPVKIEILTFLEGVDFDVAYSRRETRQVEDIQLDVISLGDLIANKNAVARDLDLLDVKELIKVNRGR
jgi:hypothetical protein